MKNELRLLPSLKHLLNLHSTLEGWPSAYTSMEMGMVLETMKLRIVYYHCLFSTFHHIKINMMNYCYIRM